MCIFLARRLPLWALKHYILKVFIITFVALLFSVTENDYSEIFGEDYLNALLFYSENKGLIKAETNKYNVDIELVSAMIFPERIRYSVIQDFMETEFLSAIYTEQGSRMVDFSIGAFQMKPSFVEQLEKEVGNNPALQKKYPHLIIEAKSEVKERAFRINRLKNIRWQLRYVSVLYDILKFKFPLSEKSRDYKIKFYASAYNTGFTKTEQEIHENISRQFFPYGAEYKGQQFAYADVALYFFKNNYKPIFGQ